MDSIPVARTDTKVEFVQSATGQGGHVMVRKFGRTMRVRITELVAARAGIIGEDARFQEVLVRASIVGGEIGGKPVKLTPHPILGTIASTEDYDRLPDEAMRPICVAASPDAVEPEMAAEAKAAQAGN